ncbi:hypothetical protein MSG28_005941 [Choristoneura fumiferana]|uniref:Uncharacterized protein n=1 Tax=Choristoneura fumiferana TaxID=7141 RepID=A0ACC0L1U3_CHOFU|nr:hypothetical protein MSG28_005941 [Choristoneura fumiferana]
MRWWWYELQEKKTEVEAPSNFTAAGNLPTNIIGVNIIDIPNKISGIAGFGSKDNSTSGDGTTTVMGTSFGSVIPDMAQQIFGANKTGGKGNDTASGIGSIGSNFGSIISSFPNKITGQNKTGIPGFGSIVSGIPNKVFGNNKTSSENETGWPNFGSVISGVPDKFFGKNKTNSENGTDSGSNGWPDFGSIISGIPDKVFGSNETGSESGFPNFGPIVPNNILGNKKNCSATGPASLIPSPTGGIPDIAEIIPGFPQGTHPTDSKNSSNSEGSDHKHREKRCHHCDHHGHEIEHDEENNSEPEHLSKNKRQTSIVSALGSGGTGLGSLGSGSSSLGSNLGSGDATLVMGMFQVLVKPLKGLPGIDGITDALKNPQSILTQPQTLLNGGKN